MFRKVCGVLSMWMCVCGCDTPMTIPVNRPTAVHVAPITHFDDPGASKAPKFNETKEPDHPAWIWWYSHESYQGKSGPSHVSIWRDDVHTSHTHCQFSLDATHILCQQSSSSLELSAPFEIDVPAPTSYKMSESCWVDTSVRETAPEGHNSGGMIEKNGVLYVAYHSTQASGASVFAYDLLEKRTLWQVDLTARGPSGTAHYQNHVQIGFDDAHQALVIYGKESSGGYVERIGIESGELLSHDFKLLNKVNVGEIKLPTTLTPARQLRQVEGLSMTLTSQSKETRTAMHALTITGQGWSHTLPVYQGMVDVKASPGGTTDVLSIAFLKDSETLGLIQLDREVGDIFNDVQVPIPLTKSGTREHVHVVDMFQDDMESSDWYVDLHLHDAHCEPTKSHRMIISTMGWIEALHTWHSTTNTSSHQ